MALSEQQIEEIADGFYTDLEEMVENTMKDHSETDYLKVLWNIEGRLAWAGERIGEMKRKEYHA
jgi:hypothetical protein